MTVKRCLIVVLVVVAGFGLWGIGDALAWWIAVLVGAVVALLTLPPRPWDLLGGVLLGVLTLAGVNVIAHLLHVSKLSILAGLGIAVFVVALTIFLFLWLKGWKWPVAAGAAVVLALIGILGAPVLVGVLTASRDSVPKSSEAVASKLDLLIVTDGSRHPLPGDVPPDPGLEDFDVTYSVGYAAGEAVRWTLVDGDSRAEALSAAAQGDRLPSAGKPGPPPGKADTSLVLFVDGTPPVLEAGVDLPDLPGQGGEVARWKQIAERAAPAGTPVFALLQTASRPRLRAWRRFSPAGRAVSVQGLASRTATDAAFRLTVGAESAETDLALAKAYQPILLFDKEETVPWVLSISDLFAEKRVELCDDKPIGGTECEVVVHPRELENGATHLRIDPPNPAKVKILALRARRSASAAAPQEVTGAGAVPEGTPPPGTAPAAEETAGGRLPGTGSAIYVHPVPVNRDGRRLLYLDYWWYLADNPAGVGRGALCGFGFVIAGVTCQNHQSDWEGITVVVDRTGPEPRPIAVQYAQHSSVIRYDWGALRRYWDRDERSRQLTEKVPGAGTRPLAYVAMGTHSSYPFHCGGCNQVAHAERGEGPHRGGTGWVGNTSGACGEVSCLQLLPTHSRGRKPALWSAYDGPWGERHCDLTYYCDSGNPPSAPGQQPRYQHPAQFDGTGDEQGGFVPGLVEG